MEQNHPKHVLNPRVHASPSPSLSSAAAAAPCRSRLPVVAARSLSYSPSRSLPTCNSPLRPHHQQQKTVCRSVVGLSFQMNKLPRGSGAHRSNETGDCAGTAVEQNKLPRTSSSCFLRRSASIRRDPTIQVSARELRLGDGKADR
jgi:hypothetical protein